MSLEVRIERDEQSTVVELDGFDVSKQVHQVDVSLQPSGAQVTLHTMFAQRFALDTEAEVMLGPRDVELVEKLGWVQHVTVMETMAILCHYLQVGLQGDDARLRQIAGQLLTMIKETGVDVP